jgi:hypothetical protein
LTALRPQRPPGGRLRGHKLYAGFSGVDRRIR